MVPALPFPSLSSSPVPAIPLENKCDNPGSVFQDSQSRNTDVKKGHRRDREALVDVNICTDELKRWRLPASLAVR
ncbi:hypothetical protein KIL84_009312, partial [Mauremys mutica]